MNVHRRFKTNISKKKAPLIKLDDETPDRDNDTSPDQATKKAKSKKKAEAKKAARPPAQTVDEVAQHFKDDIESFRAKYQRALANRTSVTGDDHRALECLAGFNDWSSVPIASNMRLRGNIAELKYAYFSTLLTIPNMQMAHVTIIDRDFETSAETTEIDLFGLQAASRPMLTAMVPNYLAVCEHHVFTNITHDSGGRLISPHVHALGWGIGIKDRVDAAIRKYGKKFQTRFPDVPGVKVDWVNMTPLDLARLAYYPWKAPHRCKTLYKSVDGTKANLHESEANDRYINYLRQLYILAMMRVDSMMFGGGQGIGARADILRVAKSQLRTGERQRTPPVHPDGIPHFWIDLFERLELTRFKLPLIKTHR